MTRTESPLPPNIIQGFSETVEALAEGSALTRPQHVLRLLSQVDVLTDSREGLDFILGHMPALVAGGIFRDGPWEHPDRLVPALVAGTLKAGGQTTLMEILSELRLAAIARGEVANPTLTREKAREFLRDVLVNSLGLLFSGETEEDRMLEPDIRTKIDHLMGLLREEVPLEEIKSALATEIELICHQRPIVVQRALDIISLVDREVELESDGEDDQRLRRFVQAVHGPSPESAARSPSEYAAYLESADSSALQEECRRLSETMRDTGLAVAPHAVLVRRVASEPELLAQVLNLNQGGAAELEEHREFVTSLIEETIHPSTARAVYGLGRLLDRGLLSHQPVLGGLKRVGSLELEPKVAAAIASSRPESPLTPQQLLLADCLCVLGQPLGLGQGRNPTCQSARGISLWSRHAPGKLLEIIRTVARTNDLAMRFEAAVVRSSEVGQGLMKPEDLDDQLDAVSLILVPHLDRIYNEMMRRAGARGEDPHKWVNPAMYGHWIPNGFAAAYNAVTGVITDYPGFLRTFYATHHPDFNRGHDLAYPNPVGIFLTSSSGALIGFHAVSILRVRRVEDQVRVFLYNPNTEGRQRWHADISPTVAGHGEEPGESSLPFHQFASRLYAFHYNPSDVGDLDAVDPDAIARVESAARESWGESYQWLTPAVT